MDIKQIVNGNLMSHELPNKQPHHAAGQFTTVLEITDGKTISSKPLIISH